MSRYRIHQCPSSDRASRLTRAGRCAIGLLAAVASSSFLAVSETRAAPYVEITYDLSDSTAVSTIIEIGATTAVPPQGSITGRQTIRYRSDSASGLAAGTAELLTFNLYVHATVGTLTYTRGGGKTFTTLAVNDLHFSLLTLSTGTQPGQRLSGGTVKPYGAFGRFAVTGYMHCYQACGLLGAPVTTVVPIRDQVFRAPLPTLTGALGTDHTVQGIATGVRFQVAPSTSHPSVTSPLTLRVTGTTFLVGKEVLRRPVPEPSTLPLVAAALGALGLALAARRRHGDSRPPRIR